MRRIGLMVLAVCVFLGADAPQSDVRTDLKALQGDWTMESVIINGEDVPEDVVKSGTLTVKDDRYTVSLNGQTIRSVLNIDPTQDPKHIDFRYVDGPQEGQTLAGIYKLEADRFTLCRAQQTGSARPTKFESSEAAGTLLVVWKRSKSAPEKDTATATAIREEMARLQGTWQLLSAETDGEKAPEDQVRQVRVTIKDGSHSVRIGAREIVHNVRFEIDPSRSPREATDTLNEGPDAGKPIRSIYRLEGDTLTSCSAPIGKERPTEIAAVAGSGHTLRVFRRVREETTTLDQELKRFEGTWHFASLEIEGKAMPEEALKGASLILKGDTYAYTDAAGLRKGVFKVDLSAKPKTIDITFKDGPEAGEVLRGIYELDGDTYKLCISLGGKPRPTEFVSRPGSGHVLEVLKRQKP